MVRSGGPLAVFLVRQRPSTVLDNEGLELPNLDAAREEAIRACGEIVRELPEALKKGDQFRLWVTASRTGAAARSLR
jgi:hypothetical protein